MGGRRYLAFESHASRLEAALEVRDNSEGGRLGADPLSVSPLPASRYSCAGNGSIVSGFTGTCTSSR